MPHFRPYSILISFISNPTAPTWWGFLVAGLMFACSMMQTLILQQFYHFVFAKALKLRLAIIGVIYRKVSWDRAAGGSRGQLGGPWRGLGPSPSPHCLPAGSGYQQFSQTGVPGGRNCQPHVYRRPALHGSRSLPQPGGVHTPADHSGNVLPLAGDS